MSKKDEVLLELVKQFDKLRTEYSKLGKDKEECSTQIKARIGDKLDVPVDGYRVSYHYDKDKDITMFDEEKFKIKDPKKHAQFLEMKKEIQALSKKYTKTETVSGSRRLIIEAVEEGL